MHVQYEDSVREINFSPDNRYFAIGGANGTVELMVYRYEDIISNSCDILDRNLSLDEWYRFIGENIPYSATCPEKDIPQDALEELKMKQTQVIFGSIGIVIYLVYFSLMLVVYKLTNK